MNEQNWTIKQWAIVYACVTYMHKAIQDKALEITSSDVFTLQDLNGIIKDLEDMLRPYRKN